MRQSPLYLNHYQLLEFSIKPEDEYEVPEPEGYPDFNGAEYSSVVKVGRDADEKDPRDYVVILEISIKPKEQGSFPYHLNMGIEGYFSVPEDLPTPDFDRQRFVKINGPALLYGAVREITLMMTSRFQNGPLMIPTVTFIDIVDEKK